LEAGVSGIVLPPPHTHTHTHTYPRHPNNLPNRRVGLEASLTPPHTL